MMSAMAGVGGASTSDIWAEHVDMANKLRQSDEYGEPAPSIGGIFKDYGIAACKGAAAARTLAEASSR